MALRDEHRTTSELEKCSAGTQAVGRKARLELVFAERQGRTILEHARVESPLKITRPYYPENTGTAQLILMSPAPGIFGGDDWTLRVRVKAGAWVQIAPQGALRVHPAPEESPARQRVELFVEAGADLHWEMEPAIPFRDSVLHQQVRIHLEPEARLFYWEAFCSGRVRHGESWEFKELRQDLQCWRGDELLLLDRYRLCPQGRSPNPGYAPQASRYFASVLVQDGNDSNALRKREAGTESEGVWAVDTPAADFLVGRMIASDGLAFRRGRAGFHNAVLPALGRVVPQFRRG